MGGASHEPQTVSLGAALRAASLLVRQKSFAPGASHVLVVVEVLGVLARPPENEMPCGRPENRKAALPL